MSRKKSPKSAAPITNTESHSNSAGDLRGSSSAATIALAIAWLAAFSLWFYSFTLPNNAPASRPQLWRNLGLLYLDLIALPPEDAPPSGWQYFPQRFDLIAVAAVILAGAWGLGSLMLRVLRLPFSPRGAEWTCFAFALGLSGISLLTLGCGLAGMLWRPLLGGLILVALIAEVVLRTRPASGERQLPVSPEQPFRNAGQLEGTGGLRPPLAWLGLAAIVPFVLTMFLGAMLPPVDFDVKEYHLLGPKEYYLQGRITFLPHNVYTSFPFLTEMLSLLAMVLRADWYWGALAGQTVLMTFAPLTALGLYIAGRRWFSPAAGWLAATIHLTTPWIYRISTIAYAEGGLAFYLFATLLAVMLAFDYRRASGVLLASPLTKGGQGGSRGEAKDVATTSTLPPPAPPSQGGEQIRWRHILLAGLLAGSAMACKYPGVLSVVIPLGGMLVLASLARPSVNAESAPGWPGLEALRSPGPRETGASLRSSPGHPTEIDWRRLLRIAAVFTAGVLLTIGPWLLKNLVETGNPVYPLLYTVFDGRDWDAQLNAKWKGGHSPPGYSLGQLKSNLIDVLANSDWHSALLFGFAPLAFLWRTPRRIVVGLWLYVAWLFLTWWAFTHRIDRFWVPLIPVVALLAGVGASWTANRVWQIAAGLAIAAAAIFNFALVADTALGGYNAYLIDLNYAREWTADFTEPEVAALNRLRERGELPANLKVLSVGAAELFDARFPVVYNTVFDRSVFEEWMTHPTPNGLELRDPAEIHRIFAEHGITHVYVNWAEILRLRMTYGYTDFVIPERFQFLREHGILGPPLILPGRGFKPFDALDANQQREVLRWAPELRTTLQGQPVFITAQVFPVLPLEDDAP